MDFTALLKTVAPWIGTALGGPLGGMAISFAGKALGLTNATQETLKTALSGMTPEQSLALKQADNEFQAHMAELGFKNIEDLEALAVQDRASARQMQISQPSRVPAILTVLITIGFFGVLIGMMLGVLKVDNSPVSLMLLGALATGWTTSLAYWLGTTRDSANQSNLLAQSSPHG